MSQPRGMCKPNKYKNESITTIILTQIKLQPSQSRSHVLPNRTNISSTKILQARNPQTTQTQK